MLMEKLTTRMQQLEQERQKAKQTIMMLEDHLKNAHDSLSTINGHINELSFLMNEVKEPAQDAPKSEPKTEEPSKEQENGTEVHSESD